MARPPERGALARELGRIVGAGQVLIDAPREYLVDATGFTHLAPHADAVVLPGSTEEVRDVLSWCYGAEVPVVVRGGGTGLAGGAVPFGGVVLSLERMRSVRSFEPPLWRMALDAGVTTGNVHRLARENGLLFPPDPGAAEQSQIGGNVATNAGGPHAFKYGVTGDWVTGLEVVLAPGAVLELGGALRKDVAGYDLKRLLIGSEGTLGIITGVWLRMLPAPAARLPVVAFYAGVGEGCAALETVLASGLVPAALEYLDGGALASVARAYPGAIPDGAGFAVMAEADGGADEAAALREELVEALSGDALAIDADGQAVEVWRWRDSVSGAVAALRGAKLSEDVAVPFERLADAIQATLEIGERHGLRACSWGHAGDGNLHSSFLIEPSDATSFARADEAAAELFGYVCEVGGSLSGEHGIGLVKRRHLEARTDPEALALQRRIKALFDPKGLLNPGKAI
jgi:glycolate oxidase subunit GlcD